MLVKNIRSKLKQAYAEVMSGERALPMRATDSSVEEGYILDWFSQLNLLQGVPFNYLCPDESLLPQESIRFFYLDNNWISCLVDGAYSLGSVTESDSVHDQVYQNVIRQHLNLTNLKNLQEATLLEEGINNQVLTGFLLRSKAVSGWPNLQIQGFSDTNTTQPLKILRQNTLSPSIMLCIFEEEADSLQISTPPEGIHFGFDDQTEEESDNNAPYTLTLKTMDSNDSNKNGIKTLDSLTLDNSYYRDPATRVVQMSTLATAIQTLVQKTAPDQEVTSAEFGLQMTVGVDMSLLTQKTTSS